MSYNEECFRQTQKHKRRMRKMGFNPDIIKKYEILQNLKTLANEYYRIEKGAGVNEILIKDMLIRAVIDEL